MSEPLDEIRDAAQRLREIADQLRDPAIGDEQAAELAREAAELVSRTGNEIDLALREAGGDEE
jgi:hypothetical protein